MLNFYRIRGKELFFNVIFWHHFYNGQISWLNRQFGLNYENFWGEYFIYLKELIIINSYSIFYDPF